MNYFKVVVCCLLISCYSEINANNSSLGFVYEQIQSDFIGDQAHHFHPNSYGLNYSFILSENLQLGVSYQNVQGREQWFSHRGLLRSFYESGETESKNYGISTRWAMDNHGFHFDYRQLDNNESSITYLPYLSETIEAQDNVMLIYYSGNSDFGSSGSNGQNSLESLLESTEQSWDFNWNLGFQYIDSQVDIVEQLNTQVVTQIDISLEQQNLSAFAAFGVNYLWFNESVSWSPFLDVSWAWELSASGEELILLSRGERTLELEQSGTRFNSQINSPDSGNASFGINLFWQTGDDEEALDWRIGLTYSRTIETEIDLSSYRFNVNVDF